MDPVGDAPPKRLQLAYLGVLFGLVAIGYGSVATAFFVADDFNYLNIVLPAKTLAEGTGIAADWEYFRPATAISFWVNAQVFGKDPTSYHVLGLLFHGVNAWLVARLTFGVFANRAGAAVAGMCFAVFPVHPEAISWISSRADVLCATGTLLCVSGYLNFLRDENRAWALFEACTGFLWALLSKDSAMILPVLLFLLTWVEAKRPLGKRTWSALCAMVLLFAVYIGVRFTVLGGFGGRPGPDGSKHLQIDLAVAVQFTVDAVRSMLMPGTSAIAPIACLSLLAVLSCIMVRRGAVPRFARLTWPLLVIFLLLLAPVANIAVLVRETAQQSRFLYIPSMFACAAIGVLVGTAAAARRSRLLCGVSLLLVGSYTVNICLENRRWRAAGDQAETIVNQLKEMTEKRHYTMVFVHGLPDSVDGAYVFRNGFDTAIKWFVDKDLRFPESGRISRADWDKFSAKRRADPEFEADILLLRWDPDKLRLVLPRRSG